MNGSAALKTAIVLRCWHLIFSVSVQVVGLTIISNGIAAEVQFLGYQAIPDTLGPQLLNPLLLHAGELYASHGRPAFPKCP